MHWEAYQFVAVIKGILPKSFISKRVLEVGSYFVNDSIRTLFNGCQYTGLDLTDGPGVDIITSGHEFQAKCAFDVVISCECLEHNPFYLKTFFNMVDNTALGGLVVFTCATTGRPEHGTSRTEPEQSPGTSAIGWDYYKNLTKNDFEDNVLSEKFSCHYFFTNPSSQDLYFVGIKKGDSNLDLSVFSQLPQSVKQIVEWSGVWRSYWQRVNNKELGRFELFKQFLNAFPIESFLSSTLYWIIYDLQHQEQYRTELIQLLERYLFHNEKAHDIRCIRARLLFHQNNSMAALFEYEIVLEQDSTFFAALHGQGMCYQKEGRIDKAVMSYRYALCVRPNENWLREVLVRILSLHPHLK